MDNQQFNDWYERALRLFDGLRRFTDFNSDLTRLLDDWERMLSPVDYDSANAVLTDLAEGRIETPDKDWGKLVAIIRRESYAYRARSEPDFSAPRYECHVCEDRGLVTVLNPHFTEWMRDRMEENLPPRVSHIVLWSKENRGPAIHTALCNCNCKRRQVLSKERDEWIAGNRRDSHGKPTATPPACGAATYDPQRMPLARGHFLDVLAEWYTSHAVNSAYEWNPS